MTQTARQYRARLDQPIRHRGRDFTLRSDDGCFWDIYLAGTLVFPDATNKANAIAIVNGHSKVPGFGQVEVPTLCGVDH